MITSNRVFSVQNRNETPAGYAAFSPDGHFVAVGGNELWLWDLDSGWKVHPFKPIQDMIYSLAFSPDQRFLVSGSIEFITLWEMETGRLLYQLKESAFSLNFTPDSNRFIYKDLFGFLHLRDVKSGRVLQTFEPSTYSISLDFFQGVAISPEGENALYGSQDKNVYCWNLETGEIVHIFRAKSGCPICTAFTSDGMIVISGRDDGTICMWDINSGFKVSTLQTHSGWVACIAVSSDGYKLLSGGSDSTINMWDLEIGKKITELNGHSGGIVSVGFSPDGRKAFSFAHDRTVRIWEIN